MGSKLIFLDVDGTLCDKDEVIPDSARKACQQARRNGHLVFLSTGRSKAELPESIMDVGFDGVIGAAGGYIEIDNHILRHTTISVEQLTHLKQFFNENGIFYVFESNAGLFCEIGTKEYLAQQVRSYANLPEDAPFDHVFNKTLIECENPIRTDINKIAFLQSKLTIEEIKQAVEGQFNVIPCTMPAYGQESGEITLPNIHKAVAIEELLQHLKRDKADTLAIGDGINDLEMLEYVEIGIAMGNASSIVKERANDITDSLEEDGLAKAFKKYQLI